MSNCRLVGGGDRKLMRHPFSVDGLPSVLEALLKPWVAALDAADVGMGEHVTATAASASFGIRRRITLRPLIEHALVQARMATDVLAFALDERRDEADRLRADARAALAELAEWLMDAAPSESTKELGLGW